MDYIITLFILNAFNPSNQVTQKRSPIKCYTLSSETSLAKFPISFLTGR